MVRYGLKEVSRGGRETKELAGPIVRMTKDSEKMLDEKWNIQNKSKNPKFLSLKKKRVREIQRLTFNILGLSCAKGLGLSVLF